MCEDDLTKWTGCIWGACGVRVVCVSFVCLGTFVTTTINCEVWLTYVTTIDWVDAVD